MASVFSLPRHVAMGIVRGSRHHFAQVQREKGTVTRSHGGVTSQLTHTHRQRQQHWRRRRSTIFTSDVPSTHEGVKCLKVDQQGAQQEKETSALGLWKQQRSESSLQPHLSESPPTSVQFPQVSEAGGRRNVTGRSALCSGDSPQPQPQPVPRTGSWTLTLGTGAGVDSKCDRNLQR
ncbi:hypothetical protein INR49_002806 [Caranx melampygus]|nr:hypothetical protein INR49_002806 [Caranx melampygus]